MKPAITRIVALSTALLGGAAQAELIKIPVGQQQSAASQSLPHKGETSATVKAHFGEPAKWTKAIGEPPISRWDYPGFAVYFEHDHVVHAVLMGSAKPAH